MIVDVIHPEILKTPYAYECHSTEIKLEQYKEMFYLANDQEYDDWKFYADFSSCDECPCYIEASEMDKSKFCPR